MAVSDGSVVGHVMNTLVGASRGRRRGCCSCRRSACFPSGRARGSARRSCARRSTARARARRAGAARRGEPEVLRPLRLRARRRARPAAAAGGAVRLGVPGRSCSTRAPSCRGAGDLLGAVQALSETRATRFGAGRTVRACSSSEASARASFAILRAFRRRFLRMDMRHFDRSNGCSFRGDTSP